MGQCPHRFHGIFGQTSSILSSAYSERSGEKKGVPDPIL
jgi:hypothetical protein